MSWESTSEYYRLINEGIRERLGGFHSAKIILDSLDFQEIETLQVAGDWEGAAALLVKSATTLEAAGADFLVLATNTMHKVADAIVSAVGIPLLHIVDATAETISGAGFSRVGLLATRYTMEEGFYRERLLRRHGIEALIPSPADRAIVHGVIFDELCLGRVLPESRARFRRIIEGLAASGAEAVVLGCTEIPLLIGQGDVSLPLFDTTMIHATKAVAWALESDPG
jgi:aspartate racemase